jgi:hypothetical protein
VGTYKVGYDEGVVVSPEEVVEDFGPGELFDLRHVLGENLETFLRVTLQNPTSVLQYQLYVLLTYNNTLSFNTFNSFNNNLIGGCICDVFTRWRHPQKHH